MLPFYNLLIICSLTMDIEFVSINNEIVYGSHAHSENELIDDNSSSMDNTPIDQTIEPTLKAIFD